MRGGHNNKGKTEAMWKYKNAIYLLKQKIVSVGYRKVLKILVWWDLYGKSIGFSG